MQQGTPGEDYPAYTRPPRTSFKCRGRADGYYADVESGCQAFHICEQNGRRKHDFVCAAGTLFSQDLKVCDHWYNVACENEIHHEADASEIREQVYPGLDARRVRPLPRTSTAPPPTTPATAAAYLWSIPISTTTTTTPAPQVYYDQTPFLSQARDFEQRQVERHVPHTHKPTSFARDSQAPFAPSSAASSSLSHDAANFISADARSTENPTTEASTTETADVTTEKMNIIESLVRWMSGNVRRAPTNDTAASNSSTTGAQSEQIVGNYTPAVRTDERWDLDGNQVVDGQLRPVYRPPYDLPASRLQHHEHPEDEIARNARRPAQNEVNGDSQTTERNPWLFPDGPLQRATETEGEQQERDSRRKYYTGNGFDFAMGPTDAESRAVPKRASQDDDSADGFFTPQQVSRAPYGVFDRNGNCRCPNSREYL